MSAGTLSGLRKTLQRSAVADKRHGALLTYAH